MNLLKILSGRLYKENNLSDILWATFQTTKEIQDAFLRFIGFETLIGSALNIKREEDIGNGYRIDLLIESNEIQIFIENKIWDKNYHFKEYSSCLKEKVINKNLILVSAHQLQPDVLEVSKTLGWKVLYWSDFSKKLIEDFANNNSENVKDLAEYINSICFVPVYDRVTLNAETLQSLKHLNSMFLSLIMNEKSEQYTCSHYKAHARAIQPTYYGCYYQLKMNNSKSSAWPAIGLDFEANPRLCIWLDNNWNQQIVEKLKKDNICAMDGIKTEYDDDAFTFELNSEGYNAFLKGSKEEQFTVLTTFFKNVNAEIVKHLS